MLLLAVCPLVCLSFCLSFFLSPACLVSFFPWFIIFFPVSSFLSYAALLSRFLSFLLFFLCFSPLSTSYNVFTLFSLVFFIHFTISSCPLFVISPPRSLPSPPPPLLLLIVLLFSRCPFITQSNLPSRRRLQAPLSHDCEYNRERGVVSSCLTGPTQAEDEGFSSLFTAQSEARMMWRSPVLTF